MPQRLRVAILGLTLASWLAAPAASAFSIMLGEETGGALVRWPSNVLTYKVSPACSADLPAASCLQAVDDSFAAWLSQPCSSIQFQKDTSAWTNTNLQLSAFGYQNFKNELAWIEDSRWVYGRYVLGVTAPYFNPSNGEISEADIVFNGYHETWSLSGGDWSTDVKNVAVHEIGHFFGLQHVLYGYSSSNPPTMAPEADPYMKSRTPEADDLDGVCFLYPAGTYACASNADCPAVVADGANGEYYAGQLTCDAQKRCGGISNDIPVGTAQLGDSCVGSGDCVNGMTCYPLNASGGVCATSCTTSPDSCPDGFECAPYETLPSQGLCFEGFGGGTKGVGEPCASSQECTTNLCVPDSGGLRCRMPCTVDSNCPIGQTCSPIPGSPFGACVEGGSSGGDKANGVTCASGDECTSGLCAGSGVSFVCTQPCSGGSGCPNGYACLPLEGGSGGCFRSEDKGTGEVCESGVDCASGLCFEGPDGAGWCSGRCAVAADCPCGMVCEELQYYDDDDQLVTERLCNLGEPVGCLPRGTPCTDDSECAGGACFRGVCEVACSALLGGGGCSADQGCARIDATTIDGICSAPGANQEGDPCGQDNACQSLFCHANQCATACNPVASNCGLGRVCEAIGAGQIGICRDAALAEPGPDAGPTPTEDAQAETTTGGGDAVSVGRGSSGGCGAAGLDLHALGLALLGLLALTRRRSGQTAPRG
ncbi:MAG: matrixin family metalloprotease [Deltaproteobacteria bacterium]|nr:matrixin family metalloprotease [Deltaproteobacteria bacterium]